MKINRLLSILKGIAKLKYFNAKSLFCSGIGLIVISFGAIAQEENNRHLSGTITATSNGVSIIPSFSLDRPAVYFDLSMGGERLSFDPMLRFGMDGKPWTLIFWGRYKVIKDKRFSLTIGGHPAFLFTENEMIVNGAEEKAFVANRYVAGEVNTNFKFTDKFSLGLYYQRGMGVQVITAKNSDFLALNAGLADFKLKRELLLQLSPQVFFLNLDGDSGYYANTALTLKKTDFPFQLQTFFNQKIKSTIPGNDLVWNVSLIYKFENRYAKK
ncbi:hypothetical protein SAMN04488104_102829 [Algoriphagus faecimaris]|uniref:DUF481 domain-containing protein n=1 Tax=Algoriphagus faecimaris TaxID=686796 RepID=A0A1G6UGA7_9BACT|nr:hypothetical protein [Algoriphagus faecimaris]SDD40402.1 hypothetical protein SAMN04488104_102829 [Algoriphagus faecimaris]